MRERPVQRRRDSQQGDTTNAAKAIPVPHHSSLEQPSVSACVAQRQGHPRSVRATKEMTHR